MQRKLVCLLATAALTATAAWAQDSETQTDDQSYHQTLEGGRTEQEATAVTRGVYESPLNISARAGVMGFGDGTGGYGSRLMGGLNLDVNLMPSVHDMNMGVGTGLLYSHLGPSDSNFFGTNSTIGGNAGANTFLIPINLFANRRVAEKIVLGAQIGTTAVYRSVGTSMRLGRASDSSGASSTEFFPSVGLNAGLEVSKSVAIALRGDFIVTPGPDIFTVSLGAALPLA